QDGTILFESALLDAKVGADKIGFVFQNPDHQLVTDKVWHELAFGLESLGCPTDEIRTRVSEMASFFGIQNWFHESVEHLSGGQKQLLNLASVMVMQPDVLILDEPTAQLDPIAAQEFLRTLEKINRELGTTVILSEHRLEEALSLSDRVLVLDEGRLIADGTPQAVGRQLNVQNHGLFSAWPTPMRVYGAVEKGEEWPLSVREGRQWLEHFAQTHQLDESEIPSPTLALSDEVVLSAKDLWFRYEKDSADIIKGLDLSIHRGELFAIIGGNGTGKSTALSLFSNLLPVYRGELKTEGKVVLMPQQPQTLFLKPTVYEDLCRLSDDTEQLSQVAKLCNIGNLLESHPYDLSGGEQQRVALAMVLLLSPDILLLDEPTKGMDASFKSTFAELLLSLKNQGVTVVMVSHDIEFCVNYADRCALLFDGGITSVDAPRTFFSGKSFYTTSANRMARTRLPKAVLAEDIILACGGTPPPEKKTMPDEFHLPPRRKRVQGTIETGAPRKLPKRMAFTLLAILATVALTLFLGTRFFGNRKYYMTSLLILAEVLLPFLFLFERRKPKARELVLIGVLCALAVTSRAAFFMLSQFKPVAAIVILVGVCLGAESGFLVGALTAFVSNFFFGQGPWTPWQMVAFGLLGLLAGLLFRNQRIDRRVLSVFGGLSTLLVYGGVMNPASVLLSQTHPTFAMFKAAYLAGLPLDLVHALATTLFLWLIAIPMAEKLTRIKTKYGLALH
ncbi:MAG: ATP-binding cassette domain-containing protein, partial [Clostridia bacterium]|nr:ATP-binding cassette domain-containing protein [Clostridia bacterium]